jgi:hypothetical protein
LLGIDELKTLARQSESNTRGRRPDDAGWCQAEMTRFLTILFFLLAQLCCLSTASDIPGSRRWEKTFYHSSE